MRKSAPFGTRSMDHHVFIDNSNVFLGVQEVSRLVEKHVPWPALRVHFRNLAQLPSASTADQFGLIQNHPHLGMGSVMRGRRVGLERVPSFGVRGRGLGCRAGVRLLDGATVKDPRGEITEAAGNRP